MKTQKGQILIITLLVLTIVAIVTVSLVSLVNRDIQQVASTQQYEDAYNTSETQLKKLLDVYGKPGTAIADISTTFSNTDETELNCQGTSAVNCTVKSDDFSTSALQTNITVVDTNNVNDFPIYKDRTFDMNLAGYQDSINFYWDKNAAIEFELIYKITATGEIKSVRDVYDGSSDRVYTSLASDNPFDPTNHPFRFKTYVGQPVDNAVSIKLTDIVELTGAPALSGSTTTISLKVTPRMKNRFDSILLNAKPSNSSLVNQIREFTSQSYNVDGGNSTPVANVQTKVPLAAQPDSVLDSSIITNGILKNTP